jgi:hypothetical protein
MYLMGIPFGYMCDTRGPHLNTVIGAFGLILGYYPLYWGMLKALQGWIVTGMLLTAL